MTHAHTPATLLALAALAACSAQPPQPEDTRRAPRDETRARSGNPPFYEVGGRRYVVLDSAAGYVERGVASWYGPDFHGKRTATGETYDMHAMTGAHPTLPLPTWVRVTNLANGRSVELRLNDRGPFARNRIIDLSHAAAQRLGMIGSGTAFVEVQSLAGVAPEAQSAAPTARLYAQAGAFAEEQHARRLAARLADAGIAGVAVSEAQVEGRRWFRVHAGPVGSVAEYDALIERLHAAGVESPFLATY